MTLPPLPIPPKNTLATTVETARDGCAPPILHGPLLSACLKMAFAGTAGFYRSAHIKERHKGNVWGVYVRPESRAAKARPRPDAGDHLPRAKLRLEQILLVASAHLPARRLYETLGFEAYGVEPRSLKIGSEYVDDVLMILRL